MVYAQTWEVASNYNMVYAQTWEMGVTLVSFNVGS